MINNVISKNVILQDIISIKKGSRFIRINHINHGISLFGLYDNMDDEQFMMINNVENYH